MAIKLVLFLVILAIVLSIAVVSAFYYFKRQAELQHKKEMTERELEHEERQQLFDE